MFDMLKKIKDTTRWFTHSYLNNQYINVLCNEQLCIEMNVAISQPKTTCVTHSNSI